MQGREQLVAGDGRVGGGSGAPGARLVELDDRVDELVDLVDASQMRFDDLDGRHGAGRDQRRELGRRKKGQLGRTAQIAALRGTRVATMLSAASRLGAWPVTTAMKSSRSTA